MRKNAKKESVRRLRIIEGHVRKIREMVEKDVYCLDVLQQTSAVNSALKKVDEIILDSHLHTCLVPVFKGSKAEESIKELVEIYKRR